METKRLELIKKIEERMLDSLNAPNKTTRGVVCFNDLANVRMMLVNEEVQLQYFAQQNAYEGTQEAN